MTREEAINIVKGAKQYLTAGNPIWDVKKIDEALSMAIEALNVNIVRCKDCKYQDECEEMVLFDINDDEVMGHRVYWCSYGRSE